MAWKNLKRGREYKHAWRDAHPHCDREASKAYYQKHKDQKREQVRKYREANRLRQKAHNSVACAVRLGRITKPECCEECGKLTEKRLLCGHHVNGYENAHDVVWLCRICHGRQHRKAV